MKNIVTDDERYIYSFESFPGDTVIIEDGHVTILENTKPIIKGTLFEGMFTFETLIPVTFIID